MTMSGPTEKTRWRNRISRSGTLKVSEALANPFNFRTHPAFQREALAASLENVGWVQQVVVNERSGHLIDGHLRLSLAEQQGESELPCLFVDLSEGEERLVLASLDPIGAMATADRDKLSELLATIDSEDENVRTLLERIAREEHLELQMSGNLVDPDSVPEPPAELVSQPGDLWLLGQHRLLCGDSTNGGDVARLMAGKRASLMETDPPYLVDYDGGSHLTTKGGGPARSTPAPAAWDHYVDHASSTDFYVGFLRAALETALIDSAAIYQCFAVMRSDIVLASWREVGLLPHQVLIWKKSRSLLTHAHYMWDYEPFIYGWPEGHMPKSRPPAEAHTVWEIESKIEDHPGSIHPTMKPVELMRRPILYHTKPGGLIYEPFSGSGTALIAADMTGRRCYAVEQAPAFVDVAVQRWQRFSGQEALLDGDGRTFADVAAERCGAGISGGASEEDGPSPAAHTKGA
jgi:DNA modification methylase